MMPIGSISPNQPVSVRIADLKKYDTSVWNFLFEMIIHSANRIVPRMVSVMACPSSVMPMAKMPIKVGPSSHRPPRPAAIASMPVLPSGRAQKDLGSCFNRSLMTDSPLVSVQGTQDRLLVRGKFGTDMVRSDLEVAFSVLELDGLGCHLSFQGAHIHGGSLDRVLSCLDLGLQRRNLRGGCFGGCLQRRNALLGSADVLLRALLQRLSELAFLPVNVHQVNIDGIGHLLGGATFGSRGERGLQTQIGIRDDARELVRGRHQRRERGGP